MDGLPKKKQTSIISYGTYTPSARVQAEQVARKVLMDQDLLMTIFRHCPHPDDLASMSAVCRTWYSAISSAPQLWFQCTLKDVVQAQMLVKPDLVDQIGKPHVDHHDRFCARSYREICLSAPLDLARILCPNNRNEARQILSLLRDCIRMPKYFLRDTVDVTRRCELGAQQELNPPDGSDLYVYNHIDTKWTKGANGIWLGTNLEEGDEIFCVYEQTGGHCQIWAGELAWFWKDMSDPENPELFLLAVAGGGCSETSTPIYARIFKPTIDRFRQKCRNGKLWDFLPDAGLLALLLYACGTLATIGEPDDVFALWADKFDPADYLDPLEKSGLPFGALNETNARFLDVDAYIQKECKVERFYIRPIAPSKKVANGEVQHEVADPNAHGSGGGGGGAGGAAPVTADDGGRTGPGLHCGMCSRLISSARHPALTTDRKLKKNCGLCDKTLCESCLAARVDAGSPRIRVGGLFVKVHGCDGCGITVCQKCAKGENWGTGIGNINPSFWCNGCEKLQCAPCCFGDTEEARHVMIGCMNSECKQPGSGMYCKDCAFKGTNPPFIEEFENGYAVQCRACGTVT